MDLDGHHLIPTAFCMYVSKILAKLQQEGFYNHKDFQTNGLYLPKDTGDANDLGTAIHRGPHTAYREFVSRIIEDIGRGRTDYEEVGKEIKKFQAYLMQGHFDQLADDGRLKDGSNAELKSVESSPQCISRDRHQW